jgi:hypothetical protein
MKRGGGRFLGSQPLVLEATFPATEVLGWGIIFIRWKGIVVIDRLAERAQKRRNANYLCAGGKSMRCELHAVF